MRLLVTVGAVSVGLLVAAWWAAYGTAVGDWR